MVQPLCPVCGRELMCGAQVWRCAEGHSFDVARQGYVNLLTVDRKHSLHPGDTREMVAARRAFLDAGHYEPIARTLCELVARFAPGAGSVLDAGCGEGYYLSQLVGRIPSLWGIDISKEAVRYAAVREKKAHWLTATAAHLPFADGTFDCVLSMFALTAAGEFYRVLKPTGVFVQVLAGQGHLPALKTVIYPELHQKEKVLHPQLPGFELQYSQELSFNFSVDGQEMIHNLLYMTPHVWRISREGAQALETLEHLDDRAEIVFNIYSRQTRDHLIK